MILRLFFLLSLLALNACATYTTSRSAPAPVESRDNTGSTVISNSRSSTDDTVSNTTIRTDDIPARDELPTGRSVIVTPAPSVPVPPATPTSVLLEDVDAAIAAGDLERAAALCERAVRISPRDAVLWYRLATIRADQGRPGEAEGFARRALSYSASNPALTQEINALLGRL